MVTDFGGQLLILRFDAEDWLLSRQTHFSVRKKARPAGWIYRVLERLSRHDVAGLDVTLDAGLESGRRARALVHL